MNFMDTDGLKKIFKNNVCSCLDFKVLDVEHCEEIVKWGNANFLWKIQCKTERGEESFFVKHARTEVKRKDISDEIKKSVFLDPARSFAEADFIIYLKGLWGEGSVPDILYVDRENYFFVMTDAGRGSPLLVEEFQEYRVHPEIAKTIAEKFAKLHLTTLNSDIDFCASDLWREEMRKFYGKFWFGFGIGKFFEEKYIDDFYHEITADLSCVAWTDPVHRNIFVHPDAAVSFIDFDHTFRYDPGVDSGILLAHWVWMMLCPQDEKARNEAKQFVQTYWHSYFSEIEKGEKGITEYLKNRVRRWIGVYLVSRTDGRSGSYFSSNAEWETAVRETGKDLFGSQEKTEVANFLKTL